MKCKRYENWMTLSNINDGNFLKLVGGIFVQKKVQLLMVNRVLNAPSQLTSICQKSTIETLKKVWNIVNYENWNAPTLWNTVLVSRVVSLTSWQEGVSLVLVVHPSSDLVTIKIPCVVDVLLHRPAPHSIFFNWVG